MNKIKAKLLSLLSWFKSLSLRKKGLVLGLILLGSFIIFDSGDDDEKTNYQIIKVEQGEVVQSVSETGVIMSTGKVDVTSTIKGLVGLVYVGNDQEVKRGDKLFEVTSSATEAEQSLAYANYLSAKNTLDAAESNLLTFESDMWVEHEIYEGRAIDAGLATTDPLYIETNRDWLASEKKYLDQHQVISQAKISVSAKWLAYQAMADGVVKAPIDGVVANLGVAEGQFVDGTEKALVIGSTGNTWLSLSVSETDVLKIKPGQKAEVRVDAVRGKVFEAVVERVDLYGTDSSGVVTYGVYLVLSEEIGGVRPNMTVQVDILTENKDDVVRVPGGAIKPYQGNKAVQIMGESGRVIYKPVEIGIEGESYTEIVSGLEVGDQVIVGENVEMGGDEKSGGIFPVGKGGNK